MTTEHPHYRVGIDVGSYSLGLSAVEFDPDTKTPLRILNAQVIIHDAGVDPDSQKRGISRKAVRGVARRARRRVDKRRRRLGQLDGILNTLGWGVKGDQDDPWEARVRLANEYVADEVERKRLLGLAVRHIARHRGWRNPYGKVQSLLRMQAPSEAYFSLKEFALEKRASDPGLREVPIIPDWSDEEVEAADGINQPQPTVAQLVLSVAPGPGDRIRDKRESGERSKLNKAVHTDRDAAERDGSARKAIREIDSDRVPLTERMMQSDNANELWRIAEVQKLDAEEVKRVIKVVFYAKSPRGSAKDLIGKDPLQKDKLRASTATRAFQEYRIAATLANMRISNERLTAEQFERAFGFLSTYVNREKPNWGNVADVLEVDREVLGGVGRPDRDSFNEDGSVSAAPPINVTHNILATRVPDPILKAWWDRASQELQDGLAEALSNQSSPEFKHTEEAVNELLDQLDEDTLEKLDGLKLPSDRAAYSTDTLQRLTKRMRENGEDLFEARTAEFDTPSDWVPRAEAIGVPMGNPAVDRVTKGIARWLQAIEGRYGAPAKVSIEHTRDAFVSAAQKMKFTNEIRSRTKKREEFVEKLTEATGDTSGEHSRGYVLRLEAYSRQNCKCAYCGKHISLENMQMDHIVPRHGEGSSNAKANLVAACASCNRSKGNALCSAWLNSAGAPRTLDSVMAEVGEWSNVNSYTAKAWGDFKKDVVARMRRDKLDEPLDGRSQESVAWMARLAAERIRQHFNGNTTKSESRKVYVDVFEGRITAAARGASGFVGRSNLVGVSTKKTRLDRRHHAMDATILTLLDSTVAKVIREQQRYRYEQDIQQRRFSAKEFGLEFLDASDPYSQKYSWKDYSGRDSATRKKFEKLREDGAALGELFGHKVLRDEIPVVRPLRLRLGNGKAHDDTVYPLARRQVGEELSLSWIDNASTPALWCALTRHPDFDPKSGLPASQVREIVVNGRRYGPKDEVGFFWGSPMTRAKLKEKNLTIDLARDYAPQAGIQVRNGFTTSGSSHHARIFRVRERLKSGKEKTSFGMVRVFEADLTKHTKEDLFSVALRPQSLSLRGAEPKVRQAVLNGTAEYLGWLSVGDELELDMSKQTSGQVGELLEVFPGTNRWVISGFETSTIVNLKPAVLSGEGLVGEPNADGCSAGAASIIGSRSWRPSVNVLFTTCIPQVVRRTTLGEVRTRSAANLPVSWHVNG